MATFNYKTTNIGDTFTTIEGKAITIVNKVSAHALYKGSQAYLEYTIEGVDGIHKGTSAQICRICGMENEGTTYTSRTTGRTIKIQSEELIDKKVDAMRQRIEGAISTLRSLGVISHLAAVEEEANCVIADKRAAMLAANIAAQAEQDAKAAAAAQAAQDKAAAALAALTPEQIAALIANLQK